MTSPIATEASGVLDEVRRLVGLAWAVVVGQVGLVALGAVDVMMLGRLGSDALAASGIGHTWSFAGLVVGLGVASGLDPLVAQAHGAGRPREARAEVARVALLLTALSVPVTVWHLVAAPAFGVLGQPPQVAPEAARYCAILAPSILPFLLFALLRQYLQALGRMRPAMWVIGLGNGVNIAANWVLIFGNLGAPALGVAGAAWATTLVRWVMLAALAALAWPSLRRYWPTPSQLLSRMGFSRAARLSLPVGLQLAVEVWAFNASVLLAGVLGPVQVATHTVCLSLVSVSFMVPMGLGAAGAARVGNLVGAGRSWIRAGWTTVGLGAAAMCVFAAIYGLLPGPVVQLYTGDGDVRTAALLVLPIAAAFQVFDGVQVTAFGVLRGLGDTARPSWANVLGHWVLGLPTGAGLAFGLGWGLQGLWVGLSVGLGVVSVLLVLRMAWQQRLRR